MSERAETVYDAAGSTLIVRIRGEVDHHTAAEIRTGIDRELFQRRPKRMTMDLSRVSFMDSSGLGLIMGRFSVMRELGGEMTVCDPSPETLSILTLAGMERLVKIEYTREPPARSKPTPAGTKPSPDGTPSGKGRTRRKCKPSA